MNDLKPPNQTWKLKLPILYYHKITNPPAEVPRVDIYMEPSGFARQMAFLKLLGIRGINLTEFMNYFESGKKPLSRCVVITFDDGYRDNLTNALPILKKCGFSATIFVMAGFIGQPMKADYAHPQGELILSKEEICRLVKEGIDIQSHGMTHKPLTTLSESEVMEELIESKRILEGVTERQVSLFSYPFGYFNPRLEELVRQAGYRAAVSTFRGKVHYPEERFCLKRIPVHHGRNLLRFFQYLYLKSYRRSQKRLDSFRASQTP